jgi:hypothetical protein
MIARVGRAILEIGQFLAATAPAAPAPPEGYETPGRELTLDLSSMFKLYTGLMHFFMPRAAPGTGPGSPADYNRPRHVSEEAATNIATWIASKSEAPQ